MCTIYAHSIVPFFKLTCRENVITVERLVPRVGVLGSRMKRTK